MNVKMEAILYDLEYFFHDEAEEFYEDSQYKDLFKKFELLTPPHSPCQSPHHDPFPPDRHSLVDKRLEKVKEKLSNGELSLEEMSVNLASKINLASSLIQDCMWSGPCLAVSGLISDKTGKIIMKNDSQKLDSNSHCQEITSNQCVDPTAVFPYQIEIAKKIELPKYNLGSTADSPSPSESEDEEIDVVTVVQEKMARRRHSPSSTTLSQASLNSHLAAMHNYSSTSSPPPSCLVTSFSAPQSPLPSHQKENLHNYAGHKRPRPTSMPASPLPTKKARSLLNNTDLKNVQNSDLVKHVAQRLKGHNSSGRQSSRNSSDSEGEDVTKRAQHNVLERKRRNDLKYSFLRLRDNVPELSKQERSPKVTILKISSDFIRSLTLKNKRLESEHARLKARHEQLQQRLASLRRECL